MIQHILNGDSLANDFELEGNKIICREALIEGDLNTESLEVFWKKRSEFIQSTYNSEEYFADSVTEFVKISAIESNDEVNLWFGDDVFCQVNMWFCVSLITAENVQINRIIPDSNGWNCGFIDRRKCLAGRVKYSASDVELIKKLWHAFAERNTSQLIELSKTSSPNFPKLQDTCNAIADIHCKPREILRNVKASGFSEFESIFREFKTQAGIYGFGDSQVKRLLNEL
jgi:hypothetical protein